MTSRPDKGLWSVINLFEYASCLSLNCSIGWLGKDCNFSFGGGNPYSERGSKWPEGHITENLCPN